MTDQEALRDYAARRDAEAFRFLVGQYQRLVYSAASRRLAHVEDIEDVVQQTFLKLAKAAGAIGGNLAGWLYATTINSANDLVRRDQTRRRHEALAAPPEAFIHDPERDDWHKLSQLIDEIVLELPQPQQSLIVEHFLGGRSQRDLAEELHVSQPTVLRRINAAVEELRKRLANRGYNVAAPLLATVLEKIPQPSIPANVTAELAKIGLSGVSAGSVKAAARFNGSLWITIGLGAMTVMALIAGAIILLPSTSAPNAVTTAPTSAPTVATAAPSDWHDVFNNAYALQPGQNLKLIPPPPLAERLRYLLEVEHNNSPMPFIQWRWINGTLKREWMEGAGPDGASLSSVLGMCAKLDGHHISIAGIPAINMDGDWIVRDGASTEAILADLHTILLDQFKIDVRFEKNEVIKDALVATGTYRLRRIPGSFGGLQIYTDVLDHPKPGESIKGGGTSDPVEFWSLLGGFLGIPIVDEANNEPKNIHWFLSRSIDDVGKDTTGRQQVLDNITKQTGLTFKQEKRTFTTWKLTPAPSKGANTSQPSR